MDKPVTPPGAIFEGTMKIFNAMATKKEPISIRTVSAKNPFICSGGIFFSNFIRSIFYLSCSRFSGLLCTTFFNRFTNFVRGIMTWLPHVLQTSRISAPTRTIFHVFPPQGWVFFNSTISPISKFIIGRIPKNPQFQSFGNPFRLLFVHCRIYSVKDVVGFNTFLNKR